MRAGIALFPTDALTLALDMDVLKNKSEALPGYKSQVIGGGAEISLGSLVLLRGGLSKNIATSQALTIHLGLGFHAGPIHGELAVSAATDTTAIEYDGDPARIPDRAGLALMFEVVYDF